MKSQKGVGLTSVIVYIIVMVFVLGIVSVFTNFFYKNVDEVGGDIDTMQEYTRFTSFCIKDIGGQGIEVLDCQRTGEENYIVLSNGVQYTFKNNGIYRDKVKVCEGIFDLYFEDEQTESGKNLVKVYYTLNEGDQEKTNTYTLKSKKVEPSPEASLTTEETYEDEYEEN